MRTALVTALLLAAVAVGWVVSGGGSTAPDRGGAALRSKLSVSPASAPAVDAPSETSAAPAPADLPPGMTKQEARERRRLMALQASAEARFAETVDLDGLTADRIAPPVRRLFDSLSLEPVFDLENGTEGFVDGLRIAEMSRGNALARSGFRVGDRLVRLGGQPLVDPAQIAYTMIDLGAEFEVCAARETGSYCRIVAPGE